MRHREPPCWFQYSRRIVKLLLKIKWEERENVQSFGCVLKRRCTERCTFSENLPEGWDGGAALEKKQGGGRFWRAYLRTMDPEQAAAEIGRRDGYAMLGQ